MNEKNMKRFSLQASLSKAILVWLVLFFSSLVHSIGIDEITDLADGSDFPVELFERHDPRDIARILVTRAKGDAPNGEEPANVAIKLFFPEESIEGVIDHGFYNYWQSHTTGGCFHDDGRRFIDNTLLRLNFNTKSRSQQFMLPKYAGINPLGDYRAYGNVVAVLKNNIKQRATWSWDDTVCGNDDNLVVNRFESKILKQPKIWRMEKITGYDGVKLPRAVGPDEAQIWGPLDLNDVDHIILTKGTDINHANRFKGTGVRVLQEIEPSGWMARWFNFSVYTKEIVPENREKRLLYRRKMEGMYKEAGFIHADIPPSQSSSHH